MQNKQMKFEKMVVPYLAYLAEQKKKAQEVANKALKAYQNADKELINITSEIYLLEGKKLLHWEKSVDLGVYDNDNPSITLTMVAFSYYGKIINFEIIKRNDLKKYKYTVKVSISWYADNRLGTKKNNPFIADFVGVSVNFKTLDEAKKYVVDYIEDVNCWVRTYSTMYDKYYGMFKDCFDDLENYKDFDFKEVE